MGSPGILWVPIFCLGNVGRQKGGKERFLHLSARTPPPGLGGSPVQADKVLGPEARPLPENRRPHTVPAWDRKAGGGRGNCLFSLLHEEIRVQSHVDLTKEEKSFLAFRVLQTKGWGNDIGLPFNCPE